MWSRRLVVTWLVLSVPAQATPTSMEPGAELEIAAARRPEESASRLTVSVSALADLAGVVVTVRLPPGLTVEAGETRVDLGDLREGDRREVLLTVGLAGKAKKVEAVAEFDARRPGIVRNHAHAEKWVPAAPK